ncbi:MAG: YggS family pyridoxal phosphate-dependent enzyme [Bacteroidaceae bacterium]|nr:YggS family pyridoxal phosphate-dependent enzyme [Bacteroidaceae bacterium]
MQIKHNLDSIKATLSEGVALCAVSKYHPEEELIEAYNARQRIFGESHVQELVRKEAALPKDVEWHFIGHLQTNKVKYIAPFVSLIHSADSVKLIREINRQGERYGRRIPILLQLHLAQEDSKYGFTIEECWRWIESGEYKELNGIDIRGIMTMATYCDDEMQWRSEFRKAKAFYDELKGNSAFVSSYSSFDIVSMGMSHDYRVAMEEGSTMVRIGTAIFGERNYG